MREPQQRGVVLVMTLIFLSVITILAVAFLALSRRGRAAVNETGNRTVTDHMADMGLERAKAEILGRMLSPDNPDLLGPGLLVSTNYLTNGWVYGYGDPADGSNDVADVTALASMIWDPRPPVFVDTNRFRQAGAPRDFRFFVDLNRNGRFESNGWVTALDDLERPIVDDGGQEVRDLFMGDPEWIGVLRNPEEPHSRDNHYLGRYAFLIVPAGRTLDMNRIHNEAKRLPGAGFGYFRNEGVGWWEINLAAFLADLNSKEWHVNGAYRFVTNLAVGSTGDAFEDAASLVNFRYLGSWRKLQPFANLFPGFATAFSEDFVDGYADGLYSPFDDDPYSPWPGAPSNTNFFTLHDYFQVPIIMPPPGLDYSPFINRLNQASRRNSTHDRYTYYRMISQLATDSAEEYRPQVNLNFPNVDVDWRGVATNWLYAADAGTSGVWNATSFFNTVANELLRADGLTNDFGPLNLTNLVVSSNYLSYRWATNYATGLPRPYVASYYHPRIHQLMQLTANIHDATRGPKFEEDRPFLPTVFRPVLKSDGGSTIAIDRYEELDSAQFYQDLLNNRLRWFSLNSSNDLGAALAVNGELSPTTFCYEVPLLVGARKGYPNFNEFETRSFAQMERKLELRKTDLDKPPVETNQMFILGVSNAFAIELWNPYTNTLSTNGYSTNVFPRRLLMWSEVTVAATLTNNLGLVHTNYARATNWFQDIPANTWRGGDQIGSNACRFPVVATQFVLTNSVYRPTSIYPFETVSLSNRFDRGLGLYTNQWGLTLSNRLLNFLFDTDAPNGPHLVDAVSLSGLDVAVDITGEISRPSQTGSAIDDCFDLRPFPGSNIPAGIPNQIQVSMASQNSPGVWISFGSGDLQNGMTQEKAAAFFYFFMTPANLAGSSPSPSGGTSFTTNELPPLGLVHQAPFTPARRFYQVTSWQANDPLVHHQLEDLRDATNNTQISSVKLSYQLQFDAKNLGKVNDRYLPWGGHYGIGGGITSASDVNPAIKDPGVANADAWEFPEQKFPNVGWLGRVHRGTPWQTVHLKSAVAGIRQWLRPNGPGLDLATHPTNDWGLVEHFTVALTPEMTRGRLSVNQTNLAAWSAILAGIKASTLTEDANANVNWDETIIQPVAVETQVLAIVHGIMTTRTNQPLRQFMRMGDILMVPELTMNSPYLMEPFITPAAYSERDLRLKDSDYERIPQQILSLLYRGEPRFVIYAFGQSLIPEAVWPSASPDPALFGMPINYRITGEVATRSVVRVDVDIERWWEDRTNGTWTYTPPMTLERFNVLPVD